MKKLKERWDHRKWKLHLYYNGVLLKTIRINENEAPAENTYAIRVWFKKILFKNIVSGVVVKPVRILKNDETKKETYWGCILEAGTEI
jgi:hypothetical protein